MLAMDVVDTLRHQRELVAIELDDDRRQQELVARIRAIYDSQGIDVDESVIAEGVAALREDRFVYTPPERSFHVWLAEIYVERTKWLLRAGLVVLVVAGMWAAVAIPRYIGEQNAIAAFEDVVSGFAARSSRLTAIGAELRRELDAAAAIASPVTVQRLFDETNNALLRGEGQAETFATAIARLPEVDDDGDGGERYLAERASWDAAVEVAEEVAADAESAFEQARGLLARIAELRRLYDEVQAIAARVGSLGFSPAALARAHGEVRAIEAQIHAGDAEDASAALFELEQFVQATVRAKQQRAEFGAKLAALRTTFAGLGAEEAAAERFDNFATALEQAIAGSDVDAMASRLGQLEALVEHVGQEYELRILTRRNQRSGVWRHPNNNRRARNYYIIVEAISASGKRLTLPIENEETGRTSRVRKFGIRVSEATYERVKADKLDNGIIDRSTFGTKQRGRLEPDYARSFDVVGGKITRW